MESLAVVRPTWHAVENQSKLQINVYVYITGMLKRNPFEIYKLYHICFLILILVSSWLSLQQLMPDDFDLKSTGVFDKENSNEI